MKNVLITSPSITNSQFAKEKLEQSGLKVIYANCGNRVLSEIELIKNISGCIAVIAGLDKFSEAVIKSGKPNFKINCSFGSRL